MKLRLSITAKLTLVFVLFAALLLAGVGVLAYTSGRTALEAAITSDLLSTAIEKEAALNAWVEDRQSGIIALAHSPDLLENVAAFVATPNQTTHNRVVHELQTWAGRGQQYLALLVIDAETGQVIAATDPFEEGKFKENRPYFINGKNGPYVQNIYYSLVLQGPAMTAAAPLYSAEGRLLGVLAGRLNLEELNAIINRRTGLHQTDDTYLANTSNLFVTQPRFINDPAVLQLGVRTEHVKRCLARNSGFLFADEDYRGVPVIAVYRWLPERQLCLVVKLDQAEALAPSHTFGQTILFIGSLTLLAASLVAMGLARTFTRPVLALQAGAVRFGQGELDLRLSETSGDELGRLARGFNTMAATLSEKEAQLRRYTEELEQIVEERTAALRESEITFRLLFANHPHPMWVYDLQTLQFLEVNEAAINHYGYSGDEFRQMRIADIRPPEDVSLLLEHLHQERPALQRTGQWRHRLHDGRIIDVEITSHTLEFVGRKAALVVALDITERKRAEEALRQSEERTRLIVESALDAVVTINSDSMIIGWNAQAEVVFGWSRPEVLGRSLELILPPQYREAHHRGLKHFLATGEGPVLNRRLEITALRRDGAEFSVELTISPVRSGDSFIFSAFIRDITDRKLAEEQFRLVVEASPQAIILVNTAGQIHLANAQAEALFGYKRAEVLGQPVEMLLPPEVQAKHRHYRDSFLKTPGARAMGAGRDLFGVRKDGSQVPVEIGLNPITTSEGTFILASVIDITERKQMEQVLQKAHDELEARVEQRTAELTRANEQLAALYQMGQIITAPLQSDVVLDLIAQSTAHLLETDTGVILLLDEAGETLTIKGAYGVSEQGVKGTRDRVGQSIAGRVVQTGQPIIANDLPNDPRFYNPAAAKEGLLACASVPLVVGEKIIGTLDVHSRVNRYAFTEGHIQTLKMLAGQAAIAIENARLYEEVQRARDELEERVRWRTAELVAANEQLHQDIIERKRAEQALQESESRFRQLAESLPQLVWTCEPDGPCDYLSQNWIAYTGIPEAEQLGFGWLEQLHPDDREPTITAWNAAVASDSDFQVEFRIRRHDGVYRWFDTRAMRLRDAEGCTVKWFGSNTDITARKQAEQTLAFLAEASKVLASSLDYQTTLNAVAQLTVPNFADWCAVDVLEADRTLSRVAVAHTDPDKIELAHELQRRTPFDPDAPGGVANVLRTGQPELYPEISDALLEASTSDPELLTIIRQLGLKSAMVVPLQTHERVLGAITLVWAESDRYYDSGDLALGEELARRASLAVDNARLYHEAQRMNVELEDRVKERTARLEATNQELKREIAERERMEEQLAAERNLLRTLIDNLPDHIYVKDTQSRFLTNNLAHIHFLGATRADELVGKTDFDVFPHELAVQYYADERVVIQSGQPLIDREEPTIEQTTGEKKWVLATKVPLRDGQGEVIGLVGLSRDITERKRVEEELQRRKQELQDHIDSMSTFTAKVALDGTILLVNRIAQQGSGLSMETLMQTNFLEGQWWAFDPQVQARVRQVFERACTGVPVNYDEQIFVFGQVLTINFSLVPVTDADGRIAYVVAEGRDITPLKQAEEALKERGTQLEAANKELEAFAYSVSHDLRAPLRSIDGFSQALLEDYADNLDAEGQRHLQRVRAASQRMAELIDDLLALSRITRSEMHHETVNLSALAQTVAEGLRQAEPERQVEFVIAANLVAPVDGRLLRVALENLLGNAWKFTAKQPQACIEFGAMRQEGQTVYFVRDNGAGFDMTYANKLFGPFQRLHTTAEFSGSGIGLATVQRIIHRHGGRIWAEGVVDKGATFYFTVVTTSNLKN